MSQAERLSRINFDSLPTPPGLPGLKSVIYDTVTGEVTSIEMDNTSNLIGSIVPDSPAAILSASVVNGDLVFTMSSGDPINVGQVVIPHQYVQQTPTGTGVWNGTEFQPLTSDVPQITVTEEEDGIMVDASTLTSAAEDKYVEMSDYRLMPAVGSITGSTLGTIAKAYTWQAIPLTTVRDFDGMGVSLLPDGMSFVLQPGLYYASLRTNCYQNQIGIRLYGLENEFAAVQGKGIYSATGNTTSHYVQSIGSGYFRVLVPTTFQFQFCARYVTAGTVAIGVYANAMGLDIEPSMLQLWKVEDDGAVVPQKQPISLVYTPMTTLDTAEQTILASSTFDANYPAWKAFDETFAAQVITDAWASLGAPTPAAPQWLGIKFKNGPRKINRYSITNRYYTTVATIAAPTAWELQGRNLDTDAWVVLHAVTGRTETGANTENVYDIPEAEYAQYRLHFTGSAATNTTVVSRLRFLYVDTSVPLVV